jgi:hypothetical protein
MYLVGSQSAQTMVEKRHHLEINLSLVAFTKQTCYFIISKFLNFVYSAKNNVLPLALVPGAVVNVSARGTEDPGSNPARV